MVGAKHGENAGERKPQNAQSAENVSAGENALSPERGF
jgi:hypothetical protein